MTSPSCRVASRTCSSSPGARLHGLQPTTPAGFEAFVQEVGRLPKGPGLPEPTIPDVPRLVEAGRRHGNDIVGPPLSLNEGETRS